MAHIATGYLTDEAYAYDFEKATAGVAAGGPTASKVTVNDATPIPGRARRAKAVLITVEANPIRVRFDGADPTATDGIALAVGDSLFLVGIQNVKKLRWIRSGAADGTVQVTYFRTA